MKRDIVFSKPGQLAEAIGVSPERNREIEEAINAAISRNDSLKTVVEMMNDRGDLSDAEWTAFIFALGHFQGRVGR